MDFPVLRKNRLQFWGSQFIVGFSFFGMSEGHRADVRARPETTIAWGWVAISLTVVIHQFFVEFLTTDFLVLLLLLLYHPT